LITHILFYLITIHWNIVDPTVIADNWLQLFVVCNIIGFGLSFFAYIKAHIAPTHIDDVKYSGSWIYDYIMGIEFNPRFRLWNTEIDFKLFFNGRPGIIAWTLINLSFTAKQFKTYGYITDSLVLINLLQGLYVLDFFWNENWYLRTIDIAHDHFGWTLSWGDCVWLPFMYTLQSAYLAVNPVVLGWNTSVTLGIIGIVGYILFRLTNYQKDKFRALSCANKLKSYRYLDCLYMTKDGVQHNSKLLLSGLWGWARHMNYTGDIILSTVYCLCCGSTHLLPYFYCIYMAILLVVRCSRDEERCLNKYGFHWQQYCSLVNCRLIPYIY
jgi:7-dehydrocholesterol reductase